MRTTSHYFKLVISTWKIDNIRNFLFKQDKIQNKPSFSISLCIAAAGLDFSTYVAYLSFITMGFCLAPNSQHALKHVSLFSISFWAWHRYWLHLWQRRRFGSSVWKESPWEGSAWPSFNAKQNKKEETESRKHTIFNQICSLLRKHTIMISS